MHWGNFGCGRSIGWMGTERAPYAFVRAKPFAPTPGINTNCHRKWRASASTAVPRAGDGCGMHTTGRIVFSPSKSLQKTEWARAWVWVYWLGRIHSTRYFR